MTPDQKRKVLIHYINHYLSKKGLQMKPVMRDIKKRLLNHVRISIRQFNSIIKFLEREPQLQEYTREAIQQFFSPLIGSNLSNINNSENLEEIFK